jgi:hypothetical protein
MSECRDCITGSILSNGHCDMCGFDEMQFINEYDDWVEEVEEAA